MKIIRWHGTSCQFESSYDGKAILTIHKSRLNKNGVRQFVKEEIEIRRSSIRCIYTALAKFATAEREAVQGLPL